MLFYISSEAKQSKIVVDMSQPVSIQPKNQTDHDVLMKLNLLDSDDMEEVLKFLNKLLSSEKYQG